MNDLRKQVIKLAHDAGPGELRDKLVPLLRESEKQAGVTGERGAALRTQRNGINDVIKILRRIRGGAEKLDDADSKALAKKCTELVRMFMDENARVKKILAGD